MISLENVWQHWEMLIVPRYSRLYMKWNPFQDGLRKKNALPVYIETYMIHGALISKLITKIAQVTSKQISYLRITQWLAEHAKPLFPCALSRAPWIDPSRTKNLQRICVAETLHRDHCTQVPYTPWLPGAKEWLLTPQIPGLRKYWYLPDTLCHIMRGRPIYQLLALGHQYHWANVNKVHQARKMVGPWKAVGGQEWRQVADVGDDGMILDIGQLWLHK